MTVTTWFNPCCSGVNNSTCFFSQKTPVWLISLEASCCGPYLHHSCSLCYKTLLNSTLSLLHLYSLMWLLIATCSAYVDRLFVPLLISNSSLPHFLHTKGQIFTSKHGYYYFTFIIRAHRHLNFFILNFIVYFQSSFIIFTFLSWAFSLYNYELLPIVHIIGFNLSRISLIITYVCSKSRLYSLLLL